MFVLNIAFSLLLFAIALMVFFYSACLLVLTPDERHKLAKQRPLLKILPYSLLALFLILPTVAGETARGDISPWPWNAFFAEERRNGFWSASGVFLELMIFHLWAFLIPGHLYAGTVSQKIGRRPWYPYVINILTGLLLCTPWNPIYSFFHISGPTIVPGYP